MIIQTARYAKNSILAIPARDGLFKTNDAWLIENLNGRYSGREKGYILPASKRQLLEKLVENKWEGEVRLFHNSPARLKSPDGRILSPSEAKRELLK